jgi:CubicO group peptidase (beta-lactamase class C family)
VTGKPLAKVYREYIFEPLGIKETYLEGANRRLVDRGLSTSVSGQTPTIRHRMALPAGLVSTARDLRYITSVLQGRFFKDPKVLARTLEVAQVPEIPADPDEGTQIPGAPHVLFREFDGVEFIGHGVWDRRVLSAAATIDHYRNLESVSAGPLAELTKRSISR